MKLYRGGLATDDKFSVALRIIIEREGVPTGRADARFGSDFVYNLDLEPIYFGVIPSSAVTLVPVILLAFVLGHFGIHIFVGRPKPSRPQ
ncbi:hypothetical protein L0F63_005672 [Massospora cicadina]|nr:hypothetical protein L0F63_005672 [Massospora cicadina]